MHKMQNHRFKLLFSFALMAVLTTIVGTSYASQSIEVQKTTADSLFDARQFTQALDIYEELFVNQQVTSPSILLKMAFIEEGLTKIPEALYYLEQYYRHTLDLEALGKIERLAARHELEGYSYSDERAFRTFLLRYLPETMIILLSLSLILLIYISIHLFRTSKMSGFAFLYLLCLAVSFGLLELVPFPAAGIISQETTLLHEGPSSGADVVASLTAGNKVRIIQRDGAWVKIEWNDRTAFIRDKNIRPL